MVEKRDDNPNQSGSKALEVVVVSALGIVEEEPLLVAQLVRIVPVSSVRYATIGCDGLAELCGVFFIELGHEFRSVKLSSSCSDTDPKCISLKRYDLRDDKVFKQDGDYGEEGESHVR